MKVELEVPDEAIDEIVKKDLEDSLRVAKMFGESEITNALELVIDYYRND